MASTGFWPVKSRLKEVLAYAENPDKTTDPKYLTEGEQETLLEAMESEDCTPSLSQAVQMKKLSQGGELDEDRIYTIMSQPKANQQERISFK